ncbi:MAG: phosphoenolpyruvate hydrolase family protein [Zestosphaera sp.]
MATYIPRQDILKRLYDKIARGEPIIITGASTGLAALASESGGADLILFYNSGRYTIMGIGSMAGLLPLANANTMTLELARELASVVKTTPLVAGVCAVDPFIDVRAFIKKLRDEFGVSGVINFPTVAMYDGVFRKNVEKQGFSYEKELSMISEAHKLDILTTPYVFNPVEARSMAEAGADVLIAHVGYREKMLSLDEAADLIQGIVNEAREVNPGIIVVCHGDPIVSPQSFEYIYKRVSGVAGFMGFAAIERLPVQKAIIDIIKQFKDVRR